MDDRVLAAAENNARWCDLVCRSHGIPTTLRGAYWAAQRRSPDLYPDAVTLLPHAAPEDVLRCAQTGQGCSVKDSFGRLDLAKLGFDELLRAQWIFREGAPSSHKTALTWTVVDSEQGLREWAHGAGAPETFRSDLLSNPMVRILAIYKDDRLVAGAIANRRSSVIA